MVNPKNRKSSVKFSTWDSTMESTRKAIKLHDNPRQRRRDR